MSNRWGRQVDPKNAGKGSGQNYININFNFNGVKDKPNTFQGKKIDNFIQISNDPKPHPSRPNVSMETLKQKKKKNTIKEEAQNNTDLGRKKSKSRLNDAFTPEKRNQERAQGDSRSMNKKSTKKRNSKSIENRKFFHPKRSPDSRSNSRSKQNSKEKYNSRSKSRSKSQSSKKLFKNSSKPKIGLTNRPKVSNNSGGVKNVEQKSMPQKNKRPIPLKKSDEGEQNAFKKKVEGQKHPRKKLSHDESRKNMKGSINGQRGKRKSKEKEKPQKWPQHLEDDENFDEEGSYRKIQHEAHKLLFEQQIISSIKKPAENKQSQKKKEKKKSLPQKYLDGSISPEKLDELIHSAQTIQRFWRGYRGRREFINEINMMNYRIQLNKKKIAQLDPKFWDDAQSNSILKGEEVQSSLVEEDPDLHSDIEKPISESFSDSRKKLSTNRILEVQGSEDIMEKLNKLEEQMRQQKEKYEKLQSENKDLKVTLQKVSAQQSLQSGYGSGLHSMQSSLKSNMDGWEEVKIRSNQGEESSIENNSSHEFQLRLPKKIEQKINRQRKADEKNLKELAEEPNMVLQKYKNEIGSRQPFECSSPKYSQQKISLDTALMSLFDKKKDQLRDKYEKKSTMFERMLKDSFFSPRTYNVKKTELDEVFRKESDLIQSKIEEANRIVKYAKEIQEEQIMPEEKKEPEPKEVQYGFQRHSHLIEDYGNVDLNSHRSKEESEDVSEKQQQENQFNQEQEKIVPENVKESIEEDNSKAIRIFQEISQYHEKQEAQRDQGADQTLGVQKQEEEKLQEAPVLKGFETTLLFIKEYCVTLYQFLRGSEEHRNSFIEGLCSPIKYDMEQFLRSYRTTTDNQNQGSYNSHFRDYIYPYFKYLSPKSQVVTREAFLEFNSVYDKLQIESEFQVQRDFFVNSLFDAFNQSFDYERPCSYYGHPPPWIYESKALKNHPLNNETQAQKEKFIESNRFEDACGNAIARVIQWSTTLCGFIPESPDIGDVVIDQEQINHIRETRMALMLEKDLLEGEEGMLDSVIEQSEIKLQLGRIILDELMQQFLEEGQFFK